MYISAPTVYKFIQDKTKLTYLQIYYICASYKLQFDQFLDHPKLEEFLTTEVNKLYSSEVMPYLQACRKASKYNSLEEMMHNIKEILK